jgi:hypothetical protein
MHIKAIAFAVLGALVLFKGNEFGIVMVVFFIH